MPWTLACGSFFISLASIWGHQINSKIPISNSFGQEGEEKLFDIIVLKVI